MKLVPKNSDVSLADILPFSYEEASKTLLSLSDILIRPENIHNSSTGIFEKFSCEYDFTIPVDMSRAATKKIIGLEIELDSGLDTKFKTSVYFMREITSTIDIGESDFESLVKKIMEPRRTAILSEPDYFDSSKINFTPGENTRSGNVKTNPEKFARYFSGKRSFNFDSMLPGRPTSKEEVRTKNLDFYIKPPKRVSDGTNRDAVSLTKIKEDIIAAEIDEGKYEKGGPSDKVKSILESDFAGNLRDQDVLYLDYASPVVAIRKIFRVNGSVVDPTSDIELKITPILHESISDRTGKTKKFKVSVRDDLTRLLVPVGSPDFIVANQAPGFASFIVRKNDPTLFSGRIVIDYINPQNPKSVIEGQSLDVDLDQAMKTFSISGIHNIYPLIPQATFYTLDSKKRVVMSKSKNLRYFDSGVKEMMPRVKEHYDGLRLTALSTNTGINLKIEGSVDGGINFEIYRESLSEPPGSSNRVRKIFETRETEGVTYNDTSVTPMKSYTYYLMYHKIDPLKPHDADIKNAESGIPRELGQGVPGITSHRSVSESTLTYRRPRRPTNIELSDPTVVSELGKPAVAIDIKYPTRPDDLNLEDILNKVKNSRAESAGDIGLDRASLNTEIYSVIIERINRVSGDEELIGVAILNNRGVTRIVDTSVFERTLQPGGLTGRYTYVFRICRPTVGALYKISIPLKNEEQGTSRKTFEIDALKYTSNVFYDEGILVNPVRTNKKYIDILRSFDTGERVYKEYDPLDMNVRNSQPSSMNLEVHQEPNGHRIEWSPSNEIRKVADVYLIYRKVFQKRVLVASVKASYFNTEYSFLDTRTFLSSLGAHPIRTTEYSIVAVTRDGVFMPSTPDVGPKSMNAHNLLKITDKITKFSETFLF